jgi:hypothetical protein
MSAANVEAYLSNAVDAETMPSVEETIEVLARVQRERYYAGVRDEVTKALGDAYIHLQNRDWDARCAEEALVDAIRDVPWIEHRGRHDPPRDFPEYVQVKFRDGETMFGVRYDWDENWWWKEGQEIHDGDIVAYRALPTSSPASP